MGPISGPQDAGGPHVSLINFVIWLYRHMSSFWPQYVTPAKTSDLKTPIMGYDIRLPVIYLSVHSIGFLSFISEYDIQTYSRHIIKRLSETLNNNELNILFCVIHGEINHHYHYCVFQEGWHIPPISNKHCNTANTSVCLTIHLFL